MAGDSSPGSLPSHPREVMEQTLRVARPRHVGGVGTASAGLPKADYAETAWSSLWWDSWICWQGDPVSNEYPDFSSTVYGSRIRDAGTGMLE